VDAGTTELKAILFSEDGEMLGKASEEYDLIYPASGMVEFQPERYRSIDGS
jgi:glycerol kinase